MHRLTSIVLEHQRPALVRIADPELTQLRGLLFRRYPHEEWATFARFGWRETPTGLVLTLASLDPAAFGELDESAGHVVIREPYSLRIALEAERHPFGVGVIHSHPRGSRTYPSTIDDDMDTYYPDYFGGFAPDRPYVSLIFSERESGLCASGRVFWRKQWFPVGRLALERTPVTVDRSWSRGESVGSPNLTRFAAVARLASAMGDEAAARLARSCVAVVGAGGTGSPAIEVLARAGVGRLIIIDPDTFSASNLERVHGSIEEDIGHAPPKVAVAKRHVLAINPRCHVTAIQGALPQAAVVDAVAHADVLIGASDQQHSRLAAGDVAVRYLIPTIDCGVAMEGRGNRITGQIIQLIRFLAADPCPLCRDMIVPWRLAQELMTHEERDQRREAARRAEALTTGEAPGLDDFSESKRDVRRGDAYWREVPQLNTVGYLTTTAGAMAAGYAIGWITQRFDPPFERLQMNLSAPYLDTSDFVQMARSDCACRRMRGHADQGAADALITAPLHWPSPKVNREA